MPGKYEYIRSGRGQNQRRNVDEETSLQNRIASIKVQPTVHLPVVPRPCFRTAQCSCFPNAPDFSTKATVIAAVQNLLLRRKAITEFPQQDDLTLTMDQVIAHPAVRDHFSGDTDDLISRVTLQINDRMRMQLTTPLWKRKLYFSFLLTLLDRLFPSGILFHSGQLSVVQRALRSGHPLVFIGSAGSAVEALAIVSVFYEIVNEPIHVIVQDQQLLDSSKIWRSIHSALWGITLPSDADDFGMAIEKIVITEALKRKQHVLFLMPEEFLHDEVTGLGYVVDAVLENDLTDALIVPVGVVSDVGDRERPLLYGGKGALRIGIEQPYSLRDFLQDNSWFTKGIDLENADQEIVDGLILERVSRHFIYDAQSQKRVMSTHMIAYILLNEVSTTKSEIMLEFDELKTILEIKNQDFGFLGDTVEVVDYALDILRPQILFNGKLEPKPSQVKPFIHLSNNIRRILAPESVVALSIFSFFKYPPRVLIGTPNLVSFTRTALVSRATALASILNEELYLNPPCADARLPLDDAVEFFQGMGTLFYQEKEGGSHLQDKRSRSLYHQMEMEGIFQPDDNAPAEQEAKLCLRGTKENIDILIQFKRILADTVQTYWECLLALDTCLKKPKRFSELNEEIFEKIQTTSEVIPKSRLSLYSVACCLKKLLKIHVLYLDDGKVIKDENFEERMADIGHILVLFRR